MTSSMQTIHRAEHQSNYTVASNEIIADTRLRVESRMLLVYLLGRPTDWKPNANQLAKILGKGVNLVRDCINELIKYGYATRELIRKERGRFGEWVTKIFERPNLDRESIVTTSRFTTNGRTINDETVDIQSKEITIPDLTKEIFETPPISSSEIEPEEEEEIKINSFLGIKSNPQLLAAFRSMFKPISNAITTAYDLSSAAPPPIKNSKINPPQYSTDTQAPTAMNSVLRKLSEITRESVEYLRSNRGLQAALAKYPENIDNALEYLEQEAKLIKVGVGLVVNALRNAEKPKQLGGKAFSAWMNCAEAERLVSGSMSAGDDIIIFFKGGTQSLWSQVQTWTWAEVQARSEEDAF